MLGDGVGQGSAQRDRFGDGQCVGGWRCSRGGEAGPGGVVGGVVV